MQWTKTVHVTPETVTVNGYRVKATDQAWRGINWSDAQVLEQSSLMVFVVGAAQAPPDHHLSVAWMHTDDQKGYADSPDMWARYRVRPRRKGYRFQQAPDGCGYVLVRP